MHYEYGDAWFLTEIMSKRSFCVKKHPVFSLFWLIFYDLCSKIASNCPIKIWSFDLCNLPRVAQNVQHLLGIVFTCNDLDLFRWVYSILEELREPDFWSANMALTTSGSKHSVKFFEEENQNDTCDSGQFKIQVGRMNFAKVFAEDYKVHDIDEKVHVYCQGGAVLQNVISSTVLNKFKNLKYNPAQHNV